MPEYANITSAIEAPSAPIDGTSPIEKLTWLQSTKNMPDRGQQEQRRQLQRREHDDRARAQLHAEGIEREQQPRTRR